MRTFYKVTAAINTFRRRLVWTAPARNRKPFGALCDGTGLKAELCQSLARRIVSVRPVWTIMQTLSRNKPQKGLEEWLRGESLT